MVTKTPNLGLSKPAGTDLVDISQLNANADILDKAIVIKDGRATIGSAYIGENGYVVGTWLQTTGATDLGRASTEYPVLSGGWIYKRTADEIKQDLGIGEAVKFYLNVSISASAGSPSLNGITVTASPSGGTSVSGTTDSSGKVGLEVKQGLTYNITPSKAGYKFGSISPVKVMDLVTDVTGTCYEKPVLTVTVKDESGAGFQSGRNVKIYSIKGDIQTKTTDGAGKAVFTAESTGRYTVEITNVPSGGESAPQTVTLSAGQKASVGLEISFIKIYGFKIEESIADPYDRVSYTDDSIGIQPANGTSLGGWANTKLFQGIKPVVKANGGGFKDLNKRDLTKCVDGSPSNISTVGNDAFVEIPTWYIHMHAEGKTKYVKIANKKLDDTYHAMHAMDNGVLRNCFHVGCFGSYMSGNKIYSSSGKTPTTNISTQNYARYCQARGAGYDQFSWFPWNFIQALFILAYKTCDSQSVFRGYVDGSGVESNYPTSFDNDFGLAGSSNGKEQMSFLWITNLWGNVYQFIGGAKTNGSNQLMVIPDGNKCTVNDSDFTTVGSGGQTSGFSGYISEMDLSSSKVGFFPKATSGSSTTHWCDYGYVYPSYFPYVGGNYGNGADAGLFSVRFDSSASDTSSNFGSRLMYKGGRP